MNPNREPEPCPECGGPMRPIGNTRFCPACERRERLGDAVEMTGAEAERLERVLTALAERGRLVNHEGAPAIVVAGGLVPLTERSSTLLRVLTQVAVPQYDRQGVVRGEEIRYLRRDEAALLASVAAMEVGRLPSCTIAVPRSVLWVGAGGQAGATPVGLHDGVLTATAVEPAPTGRWTQLLEMTPFATEADRQTYEAWCLAAVMPTEIGSYPLMVITANGNESGKTWLVRILSWALGYPTANPIELSERAQHGLRRQVFSALCAGRVVEIDNQTGSDNGAIESNLLSALLTEDDVSQTAMYKFGVDRVRNLGLIALTMNSGRICEDLATRSVCVRLDYDPDDPRIARRAEVGELYWKRPEVSREVLAEILYVARERWNATTDWTLPGPVRRPADWQALAWRLTGARIPDVELESRELGSVDLAYLSKVLVAPKFATELAEVLRRGGGRLRDWAERGPKVLGRHLSNLAKVEPRLRKRLVTQGTEWSWNES